LGSQHPGAVLFGAAIILLRSWMNHSNAPPNAHLVRVSGSYPDDGRASGGQSGDEQCCFVDFLRLTKLAILYHQFLTKRNSDQQTSNAQNRLCDS